MTFIAVLSRGTGSDAQGNFRAFRTEPGKPIWLAAVADVGEVEIDLQPAGLLHESSQSTLIAPFVVYNDGFAER